MILETKSLLVKKEFSKKREIPIVCSLFFVILIVLLTSCSTTFSNNTPDWVLNPTTEYPVADYLSAVGFGPDRTTAENSAVASLAKQIRQSVQADSTANEKLIETSKGWNTSRDIDTSVQTSTDVIISGISIDQVWETKQNKEVVFYAIAIMNREESGNYYKNKAKDNADVIQNQIIDAYSKMGTFYALNTLQKAAVLAVENDYYLDVLAVVNPDMRRIVIPEYKNGASVIELARRAQNSITVSIYVEDDVDGRIAASFAKVIQSYGINTSTSTTSENNSTSYSLNAKVQIKPISITSDSKNKYVRYVLDTVLLEKVSGKNVYQFSTSGREAHMTESEAAQRAIRTIENEVKAKFQDGIESLME